MDQVEKFVSRSGISVYGMPVETFPGHVNNIYLIVDGGTFTLVDVGSGTDDSIKGLRRSFDEVRTRFGERVSLDDVGHVVITHAHIVTSAGSATLPARRERASGSTSWTRGC